MTTELACEVYELMVNKPSLDIWHRYLSFITPRKWLECWIWHGTTDKAGYGQFWLNGSNKRAARQMAHWVYGELPRELVVDHVVCNNPPCVNPLHLVPTTTWGNLERTEFHAAINARKTHCPKGHPLTEDNLQPHFLRKGHRVCWICYKERKRAWGKRNWAKKKEIKIAAGELPKKRALKIHCAKGHELVPDRYRSNRPGARYCEICHQDYFREWQRKKRARLKLEANIE